MPNRSGLRLGHQLYILLDEPVRVWLFREGRFFVLDELVKTSLKPGLKNIILFEVECMSKHDLTSTRDHAEMPGKQDYVLLTPS